MATVTEGMWEMLVIFNNGPLDFVHLEQQEEPGDVRGALQTALTHTDGPVVLDMVVDPNALSLPAHTPAATFRNFTFSLAKQVVHGNMDDVIDTAEHIIDLL